MDYTEAWGGELVEVLAEGGRGSGEEEGGVATAAHFQRRLLDLLALPDELLVRVLASLSSLADASNAFAACHRLYSIYLDDHYWRAVVKGRWGVRGRGLRQSAGIDVPWRCFVKEKLALFREGAMEWKTKAKIGEAPVSRYTHTGTVVGRKIYYIGGQTSPDVPRLNEIWAYDVDKGSFERVELVSGAVPNFARHTAVAIGTKIWVYGGYDGIGSFFGLALFDTEALTWTYPKVHGEEPPPRSNHSAAAVGNKMYVFGGSANLQGHYTILGDFHEFDTETMTWTRLDTRFKCPSPRVGHRMVSLGQRVFLFGGGVWSVDDGWHTKLNELCIYDTRARQWTHLPSALQTPPVCSYPFLFVAGCHLCVFGGQSLNDVAVTNELYMLDTKRRSPRSRGTSRVPRDMGVANVVGDTCLLYGGGGSLYSAVDFWELRFDKVAFAKHPEPAVSSAHM
ncbi:kelch repeat protein [Acanthamoeba castellanii str. Neff]|uniref:Kelch repeat protein n=1 Tax=Acanthamoeba castellanii (strain ATCC 30010 / Neff) TaxID=1257118 RepID=L8GPE0_ACACF|nr:kelch repeat protein [Acanthamoeba castellanii str. Neff]ELR14777.1 kelch repeat protein [Acanthamoeba castellanii str. Neff]